MTRLIRPSALRRLKNTYRQGESILNPMTRHVMKKMGQPDSDPERRVDVMHPSTLSKPEWCGRQDFYSIVGYPSQKVKMANPSFTMENILTEGTNIHRKYQGWLWEMGVLFGWWQCRTCRHYWEDLAPKSCPRCRAPRGYLRYKEVPLENKEYLIGGHADGAVHGLLEEDVLIEVKSIGIRTLAFEAPRLYQRYLDGTPSEEIWWKINRPFGSHLKQGTFYLWLSKGRYRRIVFIYESKFNQQTKEFIVTFNQGLIEARLEEARDVANGIRHDIVPDRPLWAAPDGPICQSCGYRSTCWNGALADDQDHSAEQPLPIVRAVARNRRRALRKAGV